MQECKNAGMQECGNAGMQECRNAGNAGWCRNVQGCTKYNRHRSAEDRSSDLAAQQVLAAETIDRVLALVAGQLITLTDVTAARDLGLVSPEAAAADPVRAVLAKLIDRELILAEADRYAPPEPDAEAVDRELERVRSRLASPQAFDLALARSGIDVKHLRETLREDLRIGAYLDQRFTVPGGPGGDNRRQALIDEWLAGLRLRADIIDFYLPWR
jgi:hypothetical protein